MKSATFVYCLLLWNVLLLLWAQGQEQKPGNSCESGLGADDEVAITARAYQTFLTTEFQKVNESGILPFPDKQAVLTGEKLCREVVGA